MQCNPYAPNFHTLCEGMLLPEEGTINPYLPSPLFEAEVKVEEVYLPKLLEVEDELQLSFSFFPSPTEAVAVNEPLLLPLLLVGAALWRRFR